MPASQIWHTNGRRWANQILNGLVSRPASLYLGLRTLDGVSTHPSDAAAGDTLGNATTLAECSGSGYSRAAITFNSTNFVESLSGSDSLITVAQQTFNFSGSISGITHAFLATTSDNTGVLLTSAPLSVTRNVANGDQLKVTFTFTAVQG